jgi:large subunit ribosomal protein L25
MSTSNPTLDVTTREVDGSRSARRLRRQGAVPAVVYGGEGVPEALQVDLFVLRRTLAHAGAIIDLAVDGKLTPVLLKDVQRHPVTGDPMHVDFLRVRMDQKIQTTVHIELTGYDESPGATDGGVIEQVAREVTVEALPGDLPESIVYDVSKLEMNETITLETLTLPSGVTLIDDPEHALVTCSPPRLELEPETEIETETELVGEDGEPVAEGEGGDAGSGGDESDSDSDSD